MSQHLASRSSREPTGNDPPRLGSLPPFDLLSGPQLSIDTLEEFVIWSAMVPISHIDLIRQRISRSDSDDKLVDGLLDELWKLPIVDIARHRVILSILGELRDERALTRLEEFVWYEGEFTDAPAHSDELRSCMFETDSKDLLQSRATEMLSYLATDEAARATVRIARDHPLPAVRAAAIDAHLFNHEDSREVADELRNIVRASDRPLVGLPRKVRDGDVEAFERAVFEWYERNPKHRPPKPRQSHDYPPEPRSWFKEHGEHDGSGV
jgi:hypothetical protein